MNTNAWGLAALAATLAFPVAARAESAVDLTKPLVADTAAQAPAAEGVDYSRPLLASADPTPKPGNGAVAPAAATATGKTQNVVPSSNNEGFKAPSKFVYDLQFGASLPFGDLGNPNRSFLRGATAGALGYKFTDTSKLQASYYQIPFAPVGFNGVKQIYYPGIKAPIANANVTGTDPNYKYNFLVATFDQTFIVAHQFPIIVTPGYVTSLFQFDDTSTLFFNGGVHTVRTRSFQQKFIALTIPFLITPRILATATAESQWQWRTGEGNLTNHPQLNLFGYAEYYGEHGNTLFVSPTRFMNYQSYDPYPQSTFTITYGITHRFNDLFYAQIEAGSSSPSNKKTLGIQQLNCVTLTCNAVVPTLGGIQSSSVGLTVGIGTPQRPPI